MRREKLIQARVKKGLSQRAAAELMGVSRNALSLWELGKEDPYPVNMKVLCTFFGVKEPDELDLESSAARMARMQKEPLASRTLTVFTPHAPVSSETLFNTQHHMIAHAPLVSAQPSQEQTDLFKIGIMALTLHQQQQQWSLAELEQRVTQALDEMVPDMQNVQRTSRRSIFHLIASLPFTLQHFASTSYHSASLMLGEVVSFYAASLPACWRLYDEEGGKVELMRILPNYLVHLTKLMREPSTLQKSIAGLLSQGHSLMALLEQRQENFGLAIQHCQQAVLYGRVAEDRNLHAIALLRQFDTNNENKRIIQPLPLLKEAASFADQLTPLLRGRLFARLSYAYSYQADAKEAYHYLDLAQEIFPDHPEKDITSLYSGTNHYHLYANQALTYLHLGQAGKAWDAITQMGNAIGSDHKSELIRHQIRIAVALDDLEQSCKLFEELIGLVQQDGQVLDIDNAYDSYQRIVMRWPHEQRVRQLESALQR